jgi:hypothetical protein
MTPTVVLDAVVAGLLLATIAYAMLLSRRLGALRNDKAQLEALVRSLDESSRRAEAGVAALRKAADEVGEELQQRVERGQALRSDLTYIIDLGGGLADRLEGRIRTGREAKPPAPADPAAVGPAVDAEPRPRRRGAAPPPPEPTRAEHRDETGDAVDRGDKPGVTGFPSRAERLLRRALDARN